MMMGNFGPVAINDKPIMIYLGFVMKATRYGKNSERLGVEKWSVVDSSLSFVNNDGYVLTYDGERSGGLFAVQNDVKRIIGMENDPLWFLRDDTQDKITSLLPISHFESVDQIRSDYRTLLQCGQELSETSMGPGGSVSFAMLNSPYVNHGVGVSKHANGRKSKSKKRR